MERKQFNPLRLPDGSTIDVWATWPDGKEKMAAVLLLDEGFGITAHIKSVAERLSREGYAVFVPDLYHRLGRQLQLPYTDTSAVLACVRTITVEQLLLDLKTTLLAVETLDTVDTKKVGVLGFCHGGRYSVIANSFFPLSAGVSFYLIDVRQIPSTSFGPGSPHLFFWGGLDANNPASEVDHFEQTLINRSRDFTSVTISYTGGEFFCDERPSYHPLAARQAWGHTLHFFDYLLK